ncbi:MAG: hypothetical protein WKH68_05695 [Candidatus Limnocylindria bacterium]
MTEPMAASSAAQPDGRLPLIATLLDELPRRAIRYCHWKSTSGLDRALQGRTDLDLLVDRSQADAFGIVIREIGFKPFISHESRRYPAVEDHIGHDASSGRLVHLHVYYQLILGEHYTKNHRLPLERAFLDAARDLNGIMVPPPALELTVLGLRTLLKYRDADALKDFLRLGRRGGIPPDARGELEMLRALVSDDELRATMAAHLPTVSHDLVPELLAVLARDRRDAAALRGLRRRAIRGLRPFERLSRGQATLSYARTRVARSWPLSPLLRGLTRSELRRKTPLGGGLTIALVGPDGAGKSTLVSELTEWLAWRLNLRVYYLGSAQPSRRTKVLRSLSRSARSAARRLKRVPDLGLLDRAADVITALRYLADADDRASRVQAGRSLAARGAVVLFDRFPLPGVRVGDRLMDGPRIPTLASLASSRMLRRMAARESAIYHRIAPPDHIIQLAVSSEVALGRKGNRSPESVEAKSRSLAQADLAELAPLTRIDAEQPLAAVVAAVKASVWKLL